MPYFFAWRIIFDKAYGFTQTTKIIYSVWTACFLLPILLSIFGPPPSSNGYSSNTYHPENLEQKNAAHMARLTPEQRDAVLTLQKNLRLALRQSFDQKDANHDGKLDVTEFLSQTGFKHNYTEADFERKDLNKDGFLTFEEDSK